MSPEQKVAVQVDGRTLTLSNLHKVLYPEVGFTKGEVIDYYTRIAPVLLPHLRDRPLTFKRYPDGVEGKFFFEKNAPSHAPEWVQRVTLPSPGSTKNRSTISYAIVCDLPTLVWAANLATLELHVPMWRVTARGKPQNPDLLVFDLDPGPPATIVECCQVAQHVRLALDHDGLTAYPKTSGSKGLQLYVPLDAKASWENVHAYARALAQQLEKKLPDLVVWNMKKELRTGKVLVDWSQNNPAKTTIAVYSLRARPTPTVSTPVTWHEVEACRRPDDLRFTSADALDRVEEHGDLFEPCLDGGQRLP
ncbi:MAG: bifunctional non-ous end joining protein LigD [Frankiaceae bacterium]|nr:bifunctional non-ous end joining protein LigD [Frankiaceae bacterium]